MTRLALMICLTAMAAAARATEPPDARIEQSAQAFALCDTRLSAADELTAALRADDAGPDRLIGDRLAMNHDQRGLIRVKRYTYGCRDPAMRLLKQQFQNAK